MITVNGEFQNYCIKNFSSEEIGKAVYLFYREYIKFSNQDKLAFNKDLTKARIAHIKNLLTDFNEDSIINIINYFLEQLNKGNTSYFPLGVNYFYTCVKNDYEANNRNVQQKKTVKKHALIKKQVNIQTEVVIPLIIKKLVKQINTNKPLEDQFLFSCPKCSNNILGRYDRCSRCNSTLDYTQINYPQE
jgi:predicted RNA-binding Zn-ribbon protein involved in translation (DUF1610 family)